MGPFLIALGSLPVQKTSRECTSRIQPNEVPIGTSFPSLGISLLKGGSTTPLERERASLLNGLRYRGISEYTTRSLIPRYLRPFRSDALSRSKGVVLPPLSRLMPSEGKLVPIGTSFGCILDVHSRDVFCTGRLPNAIKKGPMLDLNASYFS